MILSALLNKLVRLLRAGLAHPLWDRLEHRVALARYRWGGRRPWSRGYVEARADLIAAAAADPARLDAFRRNAPLPPGYGVGFDERVVEVPWVLARLAGLGPRTLDAGSSLNHDRLLEHPVLLERQIHILTLAPEPPVRPRANVSHVYGDLRTMPYRDGWFDAVVCVSTLDHVGLDNTRVYGAAPRFAESRPGDWKAAVAEFRRVLAPGGTLLLTVPFGRAENLGWMQVFDRDGLDAVCAAFGGRIAESAFYRYDGGGWRPATAEECADARYRDHNADPAGPSDGAAAARAVVCLRLIAE